MPKHKFQPGNTYSTGRPRGLLTKKTYQFQETLAANNYDPALTLVQLQREAYKNYEKGGESAPSYFKEACNLASTISGYVYARPKSIEITTPNPLAGMTPAEKLEAMKQAVKMLEAEVEEKEVKQIDVGK